MGPVYLIGGKKKSSHFKTALIQSRADTKVMIYCDQDIGVRES